MLYVLRTLMAAAVVWQKCINRSPRKADSLEIHTIFLSFNNPHLGLKAMLKIHVVHI